MLTEMLKKNPTFQQMNEEDQMVMARLATEFETKTDYLYKSPEELQAATSLGNRFQWAALLNLEPSQGFIKAQMAQITQVAQRKALQDLQKQAMLGNVQAIKEINVLSGIMAQEDTNKIIVLHQITRPQLKEAQ